MFGTSDFLKVDDTVQISQSRVNDGLYAITEIGDDFIRVNKDLYRYSDNLVTIWKMQSMMQALQKHNYRM